MTLRLALFRSATLVTLGVFAVLVTSAGLGAPAGAAQRATAKKTYIIEPSYGVTAFGDPTADGGIGAVDVRFADGTTQHLTPDSLFLGTDVLQFGAAVAVADLNQDGIADLVVGAPGDPADPHTNGAAFLLTGTAKGFEIGHSEDLDDEFNYFRYGSAIAVTSRSNSSWHDIWVGAPGQEVIHKSGKKAVVVPGAGQLWQYAVDPTGKAGGPFTYTQEDRVIPGAPEAGDGFGAVLAPTLDGVVVGVPGEDIGKARDAGMVEYLRTESEFGKVAAGYGFSENSPHVHGVARTGDLFGASVSRDGLAIGVPGKDIGKARDAGMVEKFTNTWKPLGNTIKYADYITRSTARIPGTPQTGDAFGISVATGIFNCPENLSVAIGSEESVGAAKAAGSVTVTPLQPSFCLTSITFTQGSTLPGKAEAGDLSGVTVSTVMPGSPTNVHRIDTLVIGAPGESIGSFTHTGRAYLHDFNDGTTTTIKALSGDAKNQAFGAVLSVDSH